MNGAAGVRALPQPIGHGRANTPGSPQAKGEIIIVFTVRGNFSSAKIAATLRYVAPTKPKVLIGSFTATADESGATLELPGLENVEASATVTA